MKLSIRFLSLLLATILAGNLFFTSCNDEDNDPAKPSTPLLATMSHYREDGTLEESESYRYDTKGRLIEMNTGNDYKVVLEYSSAGVTIKDYDEEELSYSSTINLDAKGSGISGTSDEGTTTYTYDANGYRNTMVDEDGNFTHTQTFTVVNGNYVTVTTEVKYVTPDFSQLKKSGNFEKSLFLKTLGKSMHMRNMLKSASDEINTYKSDFTFYMEKTNTIDIENRGIYFMGKQSKNPIKQETKTSSELPVSTINYTYEYDTKGRITKKMYDSGAYEVYTYVD